MTSDNGTFPAFPCDADMTTRDESGNTIASTRVTTIGLTKRELFAAMAMQGIVVSEDIPIPKNVAKWSVQCAVALLAELEKPTE